MTQNNNILLELQELGSTLPLANAQNGYSVPDGYFEGLASRVLNKIKALQTDNAVDELLLASPFLSGVSKEIPYTVPPGYFAGMENKMIQIVQESSFVQTAKEELEDISPLLGSLKKEMPYQVPVGYFEGLNTKIDQGEPIEPVSKVVSITSRKWFRYAAAAAIVGIIASALFIVFKRADDPVKDLAKFEKKLNKEIKKTSDKELADFIEYTDSGQDVAVNTSKEKEEAKDLLKDVPATDLQNFLDEIADPEVPSDDKTSME